MLVDLRPDRREFFARCQQKGAHGRCAPQILVAQQGLEAVPPLAEESRVFAPRLAPFDEMLARVSGWVEIPAVGLDGRGKSRRNKTGNRAGRSKGRGAGDEVASLQEVLLGARPKGGGTGPPHS